MSETAQTIVARDSEQSVADEATSATPLTLADVTVRFGGIVALDSVAFEIGRAETVGLIGPNGAGKTTLIDVVAGNRRPRPGEVTFFGSGINHQSSVARARMGLARTFQQLSLFDGLTVREHVLLGYLNHVGDQLPMRGFLKARVAVRKLADKDDSPLSPNALLARLGLESIADELASTQAVGVVRLVDLARALASRPRLLLLDEPVSGLAETDATAVAEIIQSIRREHGMALLVVEHNLEFARLVSDRIVALDFGKVIANGPPDEVLASKELRTAYFGADAAEEALIQHAAEDETGAIAIAQPSSDGKVQDHAPVGRAQLIVKDLDRDDVGPARLEVVDISVQYGDVTALRPLSVTVEPGTVLAVLGPNGAGKTSLANALSGVIPSSATSVKLGDLEVSGLAAYRRARLGIGQLPDSRAIFPSLTVLENLRMGFHRRGKRVRKDIDTVFELLPQLGRRRRIPAGRLSGGEQQMLGCARLLVAPPRLLIVDELSHGLAPGIVASLFESLEQLKGNTTMIVIEQFVTRAVALADNVLVLSHGDAKHLGPADEFTPELAAVFYSLHGDEEAAAATP
jgi:ABC-type branched-subunit amino acid transport system ATPase component